MRKGEITCLLTLERLDFDQRDLRYQLAFSTLSRKKGLDFYRSHQSRDIFGFIGSNYDFLVLSDMYKQGQRGVSGPEIFYQLLANY